MAKDHVGSGLFAFWRYDDAVGYLGAPVVEFLPKGLVSVKGYSAFFEPVRIVRLAEGEAMLHALEELRRLHRDRLAKLRRETACAARNILGQRAEEGRESGQDE